MNIENADIVREPFPHIIVRDVLPASMYQFLVKSMPSEQDWENASVRSGEGSPVLAARWGSRSDFAPNDFVELQEHWEQFIGIDAAVLRKFREPLNEYLAGLQVRGLLANVGMDLRVGSAVFTQRQSGWRIVPHFHDLTQVVQSMIYMPLECPSPDNGTIFYRLRGRKTVDAARLFGSEEPRNGARRAAVVFDDDEVEVVVTMPYEPNTLVAWVNSPAAIHASPVTTDARRYLFSCCVMPDGLGRGTGEIDLRELAT